MSDDRSPEAIQEHIEDTREQLEEDLDALGQKLSPEGLKKEAKAQLEDLKDVAVGTAHQAALELTGQAEAIGEDVIESLRKQPLPVTVVAATIGLGWLLMRGSSSSGRGQIVTERSRSPQEARIYHPNEQSQSETTIIRPDDRRTHGIVLGSDGEPLDENNLRRFARHKEAQDKGRLATSKAVWLGAGAALVGALIGLAMSGSSRPSGQRQGVPQGKGLQVRERVRINRPAPELYAFWRDFTNLPKVMRHLESVTSYGGGRSHWVAKGPAGRSVSWNAVLTSDRPNESLAWRSEPNSQVPNEGAVAFRSVNDETTDVIVSLTYHPPGGSLGAAVAHLFGQNPSSQISDDLEAFKTRIEQGSLLLDNQQS